MKNIVSLFARIASCFLCFAIAGLPVSAQHFKQHISYLASDSLHGRAPATIDEANAAKYIADQFDSAKCKVVFQKFPFDADSALNVFGLLDFGKDSTVIVSAHYDHLGYGSNKSKEIVKKGIHHGADDNASGVAMMIELAKRISQQSRKYNFVFAAYSAHEAGLYGSAYFAKSKLCGSLKIRSVLNFDMVGRLDTTSKTIRVSGAETDPVFYSFFTKADTLLRFRLDDENIPISDLKPFAKKGVSVLHITTGTHNDYHRLSDTEDKINYHGLQDVFDLLSKLIQQVF